MLMTHELFSHAHVLQTAALAHQLLLHAIFLPILHLIGKLFVLALSVATKEWTVTSGALIKLTDVQCILNRLLIKASLWVLYHCVALKFVKPELFNGILTKFAL